MTAPTPADDHETRLQQALQAYRAGRLDEAAALLAALADERPDDPRLLLAYATASLRRGDRDLGMDLLARVLALQPANALAHYQLGVALDEAQRTPEALDCYQNAIRAKPDFAEAHNNRGVALKALGRPEEALACFERAIGLRPGYGRAHFNLGNTLGRLKRLPEALQAYDQAIGLEPGHAESHRNRGATLNELGRFDEALASLDRAIELRPELAESHGHRGDALSELRRLDEARDCYQRAVELEPDGGPWAGYLYDVKLALCDWSGLDALASKLAAAIEADRKVVDPFTTLLLTGEPRLQRRAAERWVRDLAAGPRDAAAVPAPARDGRIRLGYFSADYHQHPVMHLVMEMLESHDRSRFELTGFSLGPVRGDAWTERLRKAFDRFIEVGASTDREVAALARGLPIDIAIDLNGFTKNARTGIFAELCAPVQASYLGYPGTMGAPFIDYLIADHTVVPEDARVHYTEKIAYLPDCYQANRRRVEVAARTFSRTGCGLPEGRFVFCCFNNNNRITPAVFDRWMRILQRVPGSVLWLLAANRWAAANLRAEAQRRGVAGERLVFADVLPIEAQLARVGLADLFLDTLPYNAHTTASDALRAGVPVLTLIGTAFPGRVAASLLRTMGLDQLVTGSAADYEDLAVALALDAGQLAGIRRRIGERFGASPLYDPQRSARHIERLFERMRDRRAAGLAPDHLEA